MATANLQGYEAELTQLGEEHCLEAGSLLWKEGDPGDYVMILLEGMLEVIHESEDGEVVVLRTLEAGAVVGELASLDGRARSATVRTSAPSRLLRIPAGSFRELLRRRPDILEQLFWLQVDRVRSLTRQVTRNHQRAITDPLTRLYNFGFFRERLEIEIERARATQDHLSLVLFDIDHFKHYNDTNGHQEGNGVLTRVADVLRHTGRRGDILARYGGEEFVALLYGASRDEAVRFAEAMRKAIESGTFPGGEKQPGGRLTISGGVATFPLDAIDDHSVIKAADMNLYKAKEGGRNRIVASS